MEIAIRDTGDWQKQLGDVKRLALLKGAQDYIGKTAGASGGTSGNGPVDFRNRFTTGNTHGFTPLSDKSRFVVVKRKSDGKTVGFQADGYATWKKKRFGSQPILIASGKMVRDLRDLATAVVEGDRALARFRLSDIAGYHFNGSGRMPKRDPVMPNDADRAAYRNRVQEIYRQLIARWQVARASGR